MTRAFQPSRPDGRSDPQIVFDLAQDADPNTLFSYDTITTALSDGLTEPITRDRVYRAVSAGNTNLLRERKRYLSVVKGKGYRVIQTSEALAVALDKKNRAETYLSRGIDVLRNARLDELTPGQRVLHESQLLIMAGLYEATRRSEQRHDRADSLIAQLTTRIEEVEKRTQ